MGCLETHVTNLETGEIEDGREEKPIWKMMQELEACGVEDNRSVEELLTFIGDEQSRKEKVSDSHYPDFLCTSLLITFKKTLV